MIFLFLFSSKGNSGKSAKKLPKDSKKSDEESDEEWLRISHMHSRQAQEWWPKQTEAYVFMSINQ